MEKLSPDVRFQLSHRSTRTKITSFVRRLPLTARIETKTFLDIVLPRGRKYLRRGGQSDVDFEKQKAKS